MPVAASLDVVPVAGTLAGVAVYSSVAGGAPLVGAEGRLIVAHAMGDNSANSKIASRICAFIRLSLPSSDYTGSAARRQ